MSDTQFPRYSFDYSRSLSESLATRPGPVGSPHSQPGLGRWNGISFVYDPPLHRKEESKPYTDRYDFCTSFSLFFNDCFLSPLLHPALFRDPPAADIQLISPTRAHLSVTLVAPC